MNNQLAMTTTPHPTDALPLPELPTTSYLGDGNGYGYDSSDMYAYGYIVRREGYELAMNSLESKRINTDYESFKRLTLAATALCEQQGLAINGDLTEQIEALTKALAAPAQQQAGATEVSDEMISQALAAACFFDTKQSRKDMRNALEAALKAGGED